MNGLHYILLGVITALIIFIRNARKRRDKKRDQEALKKMVFESGRLSGKSNHALSMALGRPTPPPPPPDRKRYTYKATEPPPPAKSYEDDTILFNYRNLDSDVHMGSHHSAPDYGGGGDFGGGGSTDSWGSSDSGNSSDSSSYDSGSSSSND